MQIKTVERKVIFKFDEVSNKILEEMCYFEKKKKKKKNSFAHIPFLKM